MNQNRTVVLGLGDFIDKIGYQAAEYARRGINVEYLVTDNTGFSQKKGHEYKTAVTIIPLRIFSRFVATVRWFAKHRPDFTEIYHTGIFTLINTLIAKIFLTKVIFIIRGGEFGDQPNQSQGNLKKMIFLLSLKLADKIILKEKNLWDSAARQGIPLKKMVHIGNCIPLPLLNERNERDIDILYLNAVIPERNPNLLVRSFYELLKEKSDLKIVMAGFTHLNKSAYVRKKQTELEVLELIRELNLNDKIEVLGFVSNPHEYHKRAKIFVLPGDVIYANYALLESMSYGVVPVVTNGEGAEKIIKHDSNGIICEKSAAALTVALNRVLTDNNLRNQYSLTARKTIEEDFSIQSWGEKMLTTRSSLMA